MSRTDDIRQFYDILSSLERRLGGPRTLKDCTGRMGWPKQGVYFFFECGEQRLQSGTGLRVARVGTHAVSRGSKTTLWKRLANHRGTLATGGGNHRGSVFRLLVGLAILKRHGLSCPTWGQRGSASRETREKEYPIERIVSRYIRSMPFLWIRAKDVPSPSSVRAYIERNSIALLSNHRKAGELQIDSPSPSWLGSFCCKDKIRSSGLWNSNHVDEDYDPRFLSTLSKLVEQM
jgi:hypothetical protein